MTGAFPHPNLYYRPGFLDSELGTEVWGWLEAIPEVPPTKERTSSRPGDPLVFAAPWYRNPKNPAKRRVELQCGLVGVVGQLHEGPAIPPILQRLLVVAAAELAVHGARIPQAEFRSIYINRYDADGSINPHWDREHFGEVVAGISLGAPATLHFYDKDAKDDTVLTLELGPESLYAFWGQIRHKPWVHTLDVTAGRRYGGDVPMTAVPLASRSPKPSDQTGPKARGSPPTQLESRDAAGTASRPMATPCAVRCERTRKELGP